MAMVTALQEMFRRDRKPGDLLFSLVFFLFTLFLLWNIGSQTKWMPRTSLTSQPAFWPAISIVMMTFFSALKLMGSILSARTEGRLAEAWFWIKAFEYAGWFLVYVTTVPLLGYLLSTIIFCCALVLRLGYRRPSAFVFAAAFAIMVVLIFKTFLQVNVPGGQIYDLLPVGLRSFFLTYF